jgi:hypothetical protein
MSPSIAFLIFYHFLAPILVCSLLQSLICGVGPQHVGTIHFEETMEDVFEFEKDLI